MTGTATVVVDGEPTMLTAKQMASVPFGSIMFVSAGPSVPTQSRGRGGLRFDKLTRTEVTIVDLAPDALAEQQRAGALVISREGAAAIADDANLLTYDRPLPPPQQDTPDNRAATAAPADQLPPWLRSVGRALGLALPRRRAAADGVLVGELQRRAIQDPVWSRELWTFVATAIPVTGDEPGEVLVRVLRGLSTLAPKLAEVARVASADFGDTSPAPLPRVLSQRWGTNMPPAPWLLEIAGELGLTFPAPPLGAGVRELDDARREHASMMRDAEHYDRFAAARPQWADALARKLQKLDAVEEKITRGMHGVERHPRMIADEWFAREEARIGADVQQTLAGWNAARDAVLFACARANDHALTAPGLDPAAAFGLGELARTMRGMPTPFDPGTMLALARGRVEFVDPGDSAPPVPLVKRTVHMHPRLGAVQRMWHGVLVLRRPTEVEVSPEVAALLDASDPVRDGIIVSPTRPFEGEELQRSFQAQRERLAETARLKEETGRLEQQLRDRGIEPNTIPMPGVSVDGATRVDSRSRRGQLAAPTSRRHTDNTNTSTDSTNNTKEG